ncbi:sigma-E processing peptidase SpoIIGA [Inconstantimicrobium mannanitabidum]|uniref:Sigma-E processing peptidase SpoIIGA n=1 Tax=Inconstantimicrobium mannanitabidum TaxID=1604901 RepID=A0ACB5RC28_9CLOT|nr:sigma-E processing peptidase SpoIIGA [Clostridium sp. TW13]GKX66604.1 sigma-E processing peptidase SpoIIGA [Clostridium sp. TW13]
MKVYVDVLLAENLIINYFLLLLTMQILKLKLNYKKIFFAASIGGIYTLSMIIPILKPLTFLPIKLTVAFIIIVIAVEKQTIITYFKIWGVFMMTSIFFSGVCLTISLYENNFNVAQSFVLKKLSLKYIILFAILLYIILLRIITFIKDKLVINKLIYDVEVVNKGKTIKFRAFLDTGNELVEPVTLLPVIILEENYFDEILPNKDVYYINYSTVSGWEGRLKGFKPDKLFLISGEKTIEKEAIICSCGEKLSKDREYEALLSRGII